MNKYITFFKALFLGYFTGVIISVPLGPAGIESVKQTLSKGFKKGLSVALGALTADLTYLMLINLGLINIISTNKKVEIFFWILSGMMLSIIGFISIIEVKNTSLTDEKFNNRLYKKFNSLPFLEGFLITFSNPMTPTLWLTLTGTVIKKWYCKGIVYYYTFLILIWVGMISWFILLNCLALKGFKIIKEEHSKITLYILKLSILLIGVGFTVFGIIQAIKYYF